MKNHKYWQRVRISRAVLKRKILIYYEDEEKILFCCRQLVQHNQINKIILGTNFIEICPKQVLIEIKDKKNGEK